MSRPSRSNDAGFTLLEMMVAVVLVGLVVTTFYQLFAGSLRLEIRARGFDEVVVAGRLVFAQLMSRDPRTDEFPWSGEDEKFTWSLELQEIAGPPPADAEALRDDEEPALRWSSELYAMVFQMQDKLRPGRHLKLMAYRQVEPGYFTDEFKDEHLKVRLHAD